jgi:hypothetical protein
VELEAHGHLPFRRLLTSVAFLLILSLGHLDTLAKDLETNRLAALDSGGSVAHVPLANFSDAQPLLQRFQDALSLSTTVVPQQKNSQSLKDVLSETEEKKPIISVRMNTSLLSGRLKGEGEIVDSSPSGPATQNTGSDSRYRLMRFGLAGTQEWFQYGANYRVAGEGFAANQDQASREVWGEWRVGVVRFKTALTERWNNIDKDPRRARLVGTQEKAILAIAPPAWPELTFSYARDFSSSSFEPAGVALQRTLIDTVEAALSYARARWNARLLSVYSLNTDLLRTDGRTVGLSHSLSGSYRPTQYVTIAPSVSVREDQQRWSGARLETPSVSLRLTYALNTAFNMTAFGSFSKTYSSDGLVDSRTSTMSSAFSWTYWETAKLRTTLSLDASYTTSIDNVQPALSVEDLSGLFRVQLAGL